MEITEGGVRLETDGFVSTLTIDRPAARNAIARATMRELAVALTEVGQSDARVLVMRGGGDQVFVSGGDLKELSVIRTVDKAVEMADGDAQRARPAVDAADPRDCRRQRSRLRGRGGGRRRVRHPRGGRRRQLRLQPGHPRDHAGLGRY